MKRIVLTLTALCCLLFLTAQDKTEQLSDFNALSVAADIKLELIKSDKNTIEIEMLRGDINDLVIEEKRNQLNLFTKGKQYGDNRTTAKIKLYFKELDEISASAGATVSSEDLIKSNTFEANVSSGASISLDIETQDFESDVSSGGTLRIEGTAENAEIEASSGGSFKGTDFKSSYGDLGASSGGLISLWVTESIVAKTSSGGSIKYRGNPADKDIDKDKWPGGSVIAIDNR